MSSHILTNAITTADKTSAHIVANNLSSDDNSNIISENEESGSDFLSLILSKINTEVKGEGEVSKTILPLMQESEPLLDKEIDDSALLEEATFVQILQLLEKLGNSKEGNLISKFNDKLKSLLKDATIVEEFKGAKNIQDLLKLSKKYDLGLDKISITQKELTQLEKTFPKLAQQGFFQPVKRVIASETLVQRKNKVQTLIAPQKNKKPTTLSKILQAIEDKNLKNTQSTIVDAKKMPKSTHEAISDIPKKKIQTDDKMTKNALRKTTQNTNKIATKELDIVNKNTTTSNILQESLTTKQATTKQSSSTITQEATLNMQSKITNSESKLARNELQNESKEEITVEKQPIENEKEQTTVGVKSEKDILQKNVKNIDVKHTLNTFTNDFKEKLEQYKPPIMKVALSLNPKELGKMDVTIITRGSNLHVNFASNTQTMNLFMQNQMEFKNSLVNMGFTNLEMNFSDQKRQKEEKQGNKNRGNTQEVDEFTEHIEQENTILDMVIPNYI